MVRRASTCVFVCLLVCLCVRVSMVHFSLVPLCVRPLWDSDGMITVIINIICVRCQVLINQFNAMAWMWKANRGQHFTVVHLCIPSDLWSSAKCRPNSVETVLFFIQSYVINKTNQLLTVHRSHPWQMSAILLNPIIHKIQCQIVQNAICHIVCRTLKLAQRLIN